MSIRRIVFGLMFFTATVLFAGCTDVPVHKRTVKQEIVVAVGKDETGTLADVMQAFTSQSETTQIKLLEFSNKSTELHRVISSMLAGQEVKIDAMLIEDVWVGEFIKYDYLMPLSNLKDFDTASYPEGINAFLGDNKNIYWYPIFLDTGIMYNLGDTTDLEKLEYLVEENKANYDLQGENGEEMLCGALEFINLKGSIKEGLKSYKNSLENSAGKESNYLTLFNDGTSTYMRSWASNSRSIISNFANVSRRVDADVMVDSDNKYYAISKAYGYAVNKVTNSAENCIELLEYLKSNEVQMSILKGTGTLPLKREYYQNPVILDYTDYTNNVAPFFDSLVFRPARDDYTFVSREARVALHDYIENDRSFANAVEAFERLLSVGV